MKTFPFAASTIAEAINRLSNRERYRVVVKDRENYGYTFVEDVGVMEVDNPPTIYLTNPQNKKSTAHFHFGKYYIYFGSNAPANSTSFNINKDIDSIARQILNKILIPCADYLDEYAKPRFNQAEINKNKCYNQLVECAKIMNTVPPERNKETLSHFRSSGGYVYNLQPCGDTTSMHLCGLPNELAKKVLQLVYQTGEQS